MSSPRSFKRGRKVDAFTNVNAKPHEVTAEDRATVLRLHQAGKTYREIAANTRVDRWTVEAIVTAWGHRAQETDRMAGGSMTILAIDPGPKLSAFVLVDGDLMPETATKVDNHTLLGQLRTMQDLPDVVAIEMIASYGMPVGAETFDTCVWIGRYLETLESAGCAVHLIPRLAVRLHLCHSPKAKDTNVIQALVDRFAKGQPNRGKGTKDNPGWFHGFAGDTWQAYALAVYAADKGL